MYGAVCAVVIAIAGSFAARARLPATHHKEAA